MFIAKSRIENFDDCRVGDILYEDPDDDSHDWKLYTLHNRSVAKLKSKPILPGALVASFEKKGLNIQTISFYDSSTTSSMSYATSFVGSTLSLPIKTSSGVISWPQITTTGGAGIGGGTSAKIKPAPPKSKVVSNPIPVSKFVGKSIGKSIGKLIRKVR